jgi:hypothetical protein
MENILQDQWAKYASNICYNLPQAVLGVPFKAYFDSAHVQFLRDRLLKEVTRVGAAMGIEVPGPSLSWDSCLPTARFSTLQDLDAGRHSEIEMFAGVLMRKAAEVASKCPMRPSRIMPSRRWRRRTTESSTDHAAWNEEARAKRNKDARAKSAAVANRTSNQIAERHWAIWSITSRKFGSTITD